jgi:hypothetical protein
MKKHFEITEAGKARVASLEFAEEIAMQLIVMGAEGTAGEDAPLLVTYRIAMELAGRFPSKAALNDLKKFKSDPKFRKFVVEHAEEIDAATHAVFEKAMLDDEEDTHIN